ncbi:hypothetical protein PYWP30_00987 [Pyrobaculum sp. WP30]|jgi:hypothetical protein|nr:hypothetical protein PYWP30_00987 [Pyrobaculum sp. WP30]MDT7874567.1 hypothetical protein [Pyrobaculum sp.]
MVYPPKTLTVGRCSRCGRRLYMYEDRYICKKMNYVFCDVCARKLQYKCPDGVTPLELV